VIPRLRTVADTASRARDGRVEVEVEDQRAARAEPVEARAFGLQWAPIGVTVARRGRRDLASSAATMDGVSLRGSVPSADAAGNAGPHGRSCARARFPWRPTALHAVRGSGGAYRVQWPPAVRGPATCGGALRAGLVVGLSCGCRDRDVGAGGIGRREIRRRERLRESGKRVGSSCRLTPRSRSHRCARGKDAKA
jgi:hypothetical protein